MKLKYFRRSDKNDDEGEWERLVKSSICFDTSISWVAPTLFEEDILVGPVPSNYRRILQCNRPEKGPETHIIRRLSEHNLKLLDKTTLASYPGFFVISFCAAKTRDPRSLQAHIHFLDFFFKSII